MTVDWMQNVLVILVLKYIQNNWQLCNINSERNMYNIYKYISPPCFNVIKLSLHGLNWARPVFYKEKKNLSYTEWVLVGVAGLPWIIMKEKIIYVQVPTIWNKYKRLRCMIIDQLQSVVILRMTCYFRLRWYFGWPWGKTLFICKGYEPVHT